MMDANACTDRKGEDGIRAYSRDTLNDNGERMWNFSVNHSPDPVNL